MGQRELAVILDSTHDGMIAIDVTGMVTLFNAAAERLLGVGRTAVLGRSARDVIPNTRLGEVLRSGAPELNRQQDLGGVTIITNRVPVRDDTGQVVGAVAVFRDITEVRGLAAQITNLTQVQTLLEAIINSTQDAISVVDAQGNGLLINPAYTRLTGLTEADVIGKPATVDIAEGESMHLQVLRTRRPVRGVPMKVGPRRREVVVNVAPIIVGGELKGSVGVIHDVSELTRLSEELDRVKRLVRRLEAKYTFDEIVAVSPAMRTAVEQARRAAETPVTVLLRGESGTGKELFAHALHNASRRSRGPLVRVNCAALSESLLESQLFGYVEGAFTGARRGGRLGLFEEAAGGTIFLDEVGLMPLSLQGKLLRVLQERELVRVGDTRPVRVDVRVIAATNTRLEQAVAAGHFREDLYYRLNVLPIFIPPLRQRREDLPRLVSHLLRKLDEEYGRSVEDISPPALQELLSYHWPGNVRELENVLGRAMINMPYPLTCMEAVHLPPLEGPVSTGQNRGGPAGVSTLRQAVEKAERQAVSHALAAAGGNKALAARLLGIAPRTLYYKLERLQLSSPPESVCRHGFADVCNPMQTTRCP
ncbi:MAG TPA: sigma-54-dependent Fis family transcriptional regulator [Clostridiales bacterium UBA8153]|nr:sigma-54-dependent Fis family transcriptional regulator [Clostridiales bacterium UBA8153]